jgi:hypothetical protein
MKSDQNQHELTIEPAEKKGNNDGWYSNGVGLGCIENVIDDKSVIE